MSPASATGIAFGMPRVQVFDVSLDAPPRWLWMAASLVAAVVMFACIAWLRRSLVRMRSGTRQQLSEAREALAQRTETLRWAAELADVGVWFWNLATGVVEWSDRAKAQFALPAGQKPSLDYFFRVMHPEDRDRVRRAIDHALIDRQEYHTVFRAVYPDGSHHWIAAMGRALYASDGKPISMGGVTIEVTGLRKIEDELRALQVITQEQATELDLARRFKLFAENASDVVMETDNTGVIRWITPTVRLRIGREPKDLIGERFAKFVHPDDWDRARALEEEVKGGAASEARLRVRVADDGYRWFSISMRPLFDEHHAVVGRVGGWRDIHREVQAQELATHERDRLRATLEGMLEPLVVFQPERDENDHVVDFVYVDANPKACDWIGIDRDQIIGSRVLELFPEVESSGLMKSLAAAAETGRPVVLDDFPFPRHGVGLRRIDVRAMRVDDSLSCIWRDITDRHEAAERLAQSEEQFRLLAENSTDVIVRFDMSDKIHWISPSVATLLGWTQADCIGRDASHFLATAEAREQFERDKARLRAGQGAVSRTQIRAATGDVHWMEVHTSPYRTSEGIVSGMVASMHVVDAEVLMEQDLERRARIDVQTGLLNRRELLERLAALVARRERAFGVLWCDIDGFKAINDTHGHATGDAVLEALGERIRGCLRSVDDIAGRISGDELIVALRPIDGLDEAVAFAENLRCRAAEPIPAGNAVILATISIGVTLAMPDESVDTVLARADDAMYQAKESGKNRVIAVPSASPVLAESP